MADQNENVVQEFVSVTGIDNDRARFYLESASWNLELAMASFYDNDGEGGADSGDILDVDIPTPDGASQDQQSATSRFATIGSLKSDEANDSDSEEEGQAFYAGGSERSGQQILGPPRKKGSKVVDSLFQSAKEHGAEVLDDTNTKKKPTSSFVGTGYRLGETEADSVVIPGRSGPSQPRQVDMVLKLWKDGFSIDDGPVRDFSDAINQEFLESIKKGEVPRELVRQARGREVNLNMEDHRNEQYVKPKGSTKAFSGEGHMLGSPAPTVVSTPSATATKDVSPDVDSSKPSTSIQIRLADGTRLVAKFNHTHRVSDIRNFITSSRPQYATAEFILQTTFPSKELTDNSQTLEEAKLLNAVIVQRLK
ncbi:NSFL1 cofactor p47-like [Gigantopelta aegis]|uniref:NSFL1 cofactor p47-like n=1 Tax=Gigantopelta aegis TaxID=1735272 RepID=UPI001B887D41|nr:NSFL1 cofactor p47-like [Gigantopelta aegis]